MPAYLNLTPLEIETRDKVVFYATKDFIIYREKSSIFLASCEGEIKSSVLCPSDFRNYETLDIGDAVLLVLGGMTVIIFYKDGCQPVKYTLDQHKVGRVASELFPSKNENAVIFCTQLNGKMQIVIYDFMGQKKIAQSASLKFFGLTSMCIDDKQVCCLFDSSFIVGCDVETCETLWTRFEASLVYPKLIPYNGDVIYTCNGALRKRGEQVENIPVPSVQISKIFSLVDDFLITTSNNNRNLLSFNLSNKTTNWELVGNDVIFNGVAVKGKVGQTTINAMILHIRDHISVVNLDVGRSSYNNRSNNVYRVRQTGDHIVINKRNYQTDIIAMEID
jgi:hypothetical protein